MKIQTAVAASIICALAPLAQAQTIQQAVQEATQSNYVVDNCLLFAAQYPQRGQAYVQAAIYWQMRSLTILLQIPQIPPNVSVLEANAHQRLAILAASQALQNLTPQAIASAQQAQELAEVYLRQVR